MFNKIPFNAGGQNLLDIFPYKQIGLGQRKVIIVFMHKYMNLFFYNIVDNMYKYKITHAGKVERSNNNVKIAKNPMSFEK